MGLLDDAIREHLELRRRHGADPSEVSRKEQEALGSSIPPDEAMQAWPRATGSRAPSGGSEQEPGDAHRYTDPSESHLGQETVELDMRAVLEEDLSDDPGVAAPRAHRIVASAASSRADVERAGENADGSFFEWEHDPGSRLSSARR